MIFWICPRILESSDRPILIEFFRRCLHRSSRIKSWPRRWFRLRRAEDAASANPRRFLLLDMAKGVTGVTPDYFRTLASVTAHTRGNSPKCCIAVRIFRKKSKSYASERKPSRFIIGSLNTTSEKSNSVISERCHITVVVVVVLIIIIVIIIIFVT